MSNAVMNVTVVVLAVVTTAAGRLDRLVPPAQKKKRCLVGRAPSGITSKIARTSSGTSGSG